MHQKNYCVFLIKLIFANKNHSIIIGDEELKVLIFIYLYKTKSRLLVLQTALIVVCGYMDLSIRLCCEAVFAALLKPLYGS